MLLKFSPLVYALCCRFTVVGAAIALRVGSMLANFPRWCRRYATVLLLLVLLLHYGEGKCWPNFRRCRRYAAVLLLLLLLHYGEGNRCSDFRRWCTRCVAVFTAVGAAITLRRG